MKAKRLTNDEKKAMAVLIVLSIVCAAVLVVSVIATLRGSIFSVVMGCFAAYGACVMSEKAQRIYEDAEEG